MMLVSCLLQRGGNYGSVVHPHVLILTQIIQLAQLHHLPA
jgi:hypothetical protein